MPKYTRHEFSNQNNSWYDSRPPVLEKPEASKSSSDGWSSLENGDVPFNNHRESQPEKPKDTLSDEDRALLEHDGRQFTDAQCQEIARNMRLITSTKHKFELNKDQSESGKALAAVAGKLTAEEEEFLGVFSKAIETDSASLELRQALALMRMHKAQAEKHRKNEELIEKATQSVIDNYAEDSKAERNAMRHNMGLAPESERPAAQTNNPQPKKGGFFSRFRK